MRILGLLITAGLVLVILGVALSIGTKITTDVRDDAALVATAVINETVTIVNENTTAVFANENIVAYKDFGNYTDVSVSNASVWSEVFSTQYYSITSLGIYMGVNESCFLDTYECWGYWNGDEVNVSYTYTRGDVAWEAAQESSLAIGTLTEWEDTIATVIAAVVIIGLLMAGFGGFLAIRGGRI